MNTADMIVIAAITVVALLVSVGFIIWMVVAGKKENHYDWTDKLEELGLRRIAPPKKDKNNWMVIHYVEDDHNNRFMVLCNPYRIISIARVEET